MRGLALAACVFVGTAAGADFRVKSSVYEGGADEPLSTNLTLFQSGVVYDFVEAEPREATIFDPRRGRLVLLDPEMRRKSEISTRDLTEFSAEVRARARKSRDPLLQFVAEPAFEVADVVGPARLELRSPLMTYSIVAAPCADDAAAEYREFADWYAQLNTLTRPRALPPFARMEVNRRLAEKSQAPQEIELTLKSSKLGSATRFRSVHEFGWKLLAEDRRAIEQLGRQLAEFEAVALEDYLGSHRETRLAKKK